MLLNQLQTIRDTGFDVYGLSAPGPEVPTIRAAGVPFIPVPLTRRFTPLVDLRAFAKLVRVFRRERFTIVHTHTPKAALLAQYAAWLARVPVRVHTIHGLYFPGHMKPQRRWAFVLLERITMLPSHMNLSQNPEDIPVAISERISRPDRIRLIGNGINLTTFDPAAYDDARREATRASVGLSAAHKVIGMVGRFVAEKGYLELLDAAAIIRRRVPQARFLIVGGVEPEKKDALDPRIIAERGLDDVVVYLGHRQDVADLYSIMDILALPSHREGFPRAPMEASAMGVPVVATNIRGCRQAVDDGVTGHLVPLRDPQQLAAALLDLLEDDAKRAAFGRAARAKALADFDERRVFDRVVTAYQDLLRARSFPPPDTRTRSPQVPEATARASGT